MNSPAIRVIVQSRTTPPVDQVILGRQSPSSPDIEEFRGIPYGTVAKRWEHSKIRNRLPQDEFDATRHGQSYLEYPSDVTESEFDCLNLFIARPSAPALQRAGCESEEGLPVFVWIHGGGFGWGAGSDPPWDPARLILRSMKLGKPFIAVYINYRLNMFGFGAATDIVEAQSDSSFKGCNFGLCDQHVALQWMTQNISAFGGNPDRVTVAGQSAGGVSVHAQVLDAKSRPAKPLFQRAIIQSGAMGTVGPIYMDEADQRWLKLCQHLQIAEKSGRDRVAFLRDMPASDLVRVAGELEYVGFPVVADDRTLSTTADRVSRFILGPEPDTASEATNIDPIDVLIGDCDAEGNLWSEPLSKIQSFAKIKATIQRAYNSKPMKDAILHAYKLIPNSETQDLYRSLIQFLTDAKFGLPVHDARCSLTSSSNNTPTQHLTTVQSYRIEYTNPFLGPLQSLAHHCIDLLYIFDAFHADLARTNELSNRDLVVAMQTHWIDFIWDGCKARNSRWGVKEEEVMVYGRDRRAVVRGLRGDEGYRERERRFELLARDPSGMRRLWEMLVGEIPHV